jgi:hypothetical protein
VNTIIKDHIALQIRGGYTGFEPVTESLFDALEESLSLNITDIYSRFIHQEEFHICRQKMAAIYDSEE